MTRLIIAALLCAGCVPLEGQDGGIDPDADGLPDAAPDAVKDAVVDGGVDLGVAPFEDPFHGDLGHPDVCRNDRYFVDVPVWIPAEQIPDEFEKLLQLRMSAALRANLDWVCARPEICAANRAAIAARVFADVRAVLPERGDPVRADGHRRFWRMAFYVAPWPVDETGARADGPAILRDQIERLEVPGDAACAIVTTLRAAADELFGELRSGRDFFVGRACLATSMGAEHHASAEMQRWHFDRIGWVSDFGEAAPIALIDTGLPVPLAQALGADVRLPPADLLPAARAEDGTPVEQPRGAPLRHAAAMANLIVATTPAARIVDYPALDPNGRATIAHIARALDTAVFESGSEPLVINLSLGWPPELERNRKLRSGEDAPGGVCLTDEDPVGESIRYALWQAQQRDAGELAESGPTLVVAAEGNRAPVMPDPLGTYASLFEAGEALDPCQPGQPADAFYPGAWASRPACGPGEQPLPALALVVGATDSRNLRSGSAPPTPEPDLVAPGEHVWISGPMEAPEPALCDVEAEPAGGFPATFTGSSVSAAMVSAAASRLHAPLLERGVEPTASALRTLLYRAAQPTDRREGAVRLLNLDNLQRLALCATVGDIVGGCGPEGEPEACAAALQACNAQADSPVGRTSAVGWPEDYPLEACVAYPDGPRLGDVAERCAGEAPPSFCTVPDPHSAGDAGPQPLIIVCPECSALFSLVDATTGKIQLELQLNPELPTGSEIRGPELYVFWPDDRKEVTSLDDLTEDADWFPGGWLNVSGITATAPADIAGQWAEAKAYLITEVRTPEQTEFRTDMSVLRPK